MKRAAIYARFSIDLQSEKSIEDQMALCEATAVRDGLCVVARYDDRARSGASIYGRDGLRDLMLAARAREFDVLIVEALDRLSRDQADLAGIYKRLTFFGIEICAVHDGRADAIIVGLRGLIGQLQREDGAKKVRRGMAGVVRSGRHAGGRAYGYRPVEAKPGELVIDEAEAGIVRLIFEQYAEGITPRAIAAELNRQHIPPPRGMRWNGSTINGNRSRGHGMLLNELYVGRIVWNKVRMIKDPDTGRRVSRPNPASEHQRVEAPHLRIVEEQLWQMVQDVKHRKGKQPAQRSRKPRRMLSGLLRCGSCQGGMSACGSDRSGKIRVRCSTLHETGSCENRSTFYLDALERAVLAHLHDYLADPRYMGEFVREYNVERARLAAGVDAARARLERRAGEVRRELDRALDAILKGIVDPETFRERIAALEAERNRVAVGLARANSETTPIALHPAAIDRYGKTLEELRQALAAGITAGDDELIATFRGLVAQVIVHPRNEPGEIKLEIHGRLAELIRPAFTKGSLSVGSLVAEEGLDDKAHVDEPIFRIVSAG